MILKSAEHFIQCCEIQQENVYWVLNLWNDSEMTCEIRNDLWNEVDIYSMSVCMYVPYTDK